MKSALAALALAGALPCGAQQARPADPAPTPVAAAEARRNGEPEVRRTVVEDDSTRIEQLSVRGVPQRIVVTSKTAGGTSYEIITGDGSRDLTAGPSSARGAVGQRVWRMFSF